MPLRVLLVERSTLVRTGLRRILEEEASIEVVAEVSDGRDAIAVLRQSAVDVVVICATADRDAGRAAAIASLRLAAEVKIVCVNHWADQRDIDGAVNAGTLGCVSVWDATDTELKMAVCLAGRGERYLSPGLSTGPVAGWEADHERLTARETEILVLIAESKSNREIAGELNLSVNTIAVHRNHIMKKVGVRKATALAIYAAERGLLSRK